LVDADAKIGYNNYMLSKKESQMVATKEFGMFSKQGNIVVESLVNYARAANLTWPETYDALRKLADSDSELYGEAMDTVVRECVYSTLGFKTDFYV
jgi:hypothetical protein